MFSSLYTKGQAEALKNSHGVGKPLPPDGKALVIPRAKTYGGGLIRIAPSDKKKRGNRLYRIEVLTEQELEKALETA